MASVHLDISLFVASLEKMPTLTNPDDQSNRAVALRTGTDDKSLRPDESAYKLAYKKLAKKDYFDRDRFCSNGTGARAETAKLGDTQRGDKPLHSVQLGNHCHTLTTEERRGRDSNPRYGRIPIRRFSKPLP